jgi:putative transposase
MISYARGLVLKHGDRLMVFKNKLDEHRIQFEYTDNGQYVTETIGENYRAIKSGKYTLSHSPLVPIGKKDDEKFVTLPSHIPPKKEAGVANKNKYIRAAIRKKIPACSLPKLREMIEHVYAEIQANESRELHQFLKPSPSTVREWIRTYKRNGSMAFSVVDKRGIRKARRRIASKVNDLLDEVLQKHYLKPRGETVRTTHRLLEREIGAINMNEGQDLKCPSLSTLNRRVQELPKMLVDRHRYGSAYAKNKWRYSMHGDQSTRIMERVEVDHTMLDIWILDPISGLPLGRPWVTILIDRYSGYILGLHVSFYGPSASTIASALRMSIEPKDLLCQAIPVLQNSWTVYGVAELYVMDNGKEMHSHRFRRIGWELQTDFVYNPVRQPWLKASIERTMMEVCRILPAQGRVYTPVKNSLAPDPKKTATILFDDLCEGLMIWAVDVYPLRINRSSLTRPIDLWNEGLQSTPPVALPQLTDNLDLTMGISMDRTVGGDGMTFQYLRYNSLELRDYCRGKNHSFRTEVRIVPDDISYAFINLPKEDRWLKVDLVRPTYDFTNNISLLQHQIIRKEAGQKLTLKNAEEELNNAWHRLRDRWSLAISRGKALKKQTDLIRLQNLTSARLLDKSSLTQSTDVPEVSETLKLNFEQITPFKAFRLDEDET